MIIWGFSRTTQRLRFKSLFQTKSIQKKLIFQLVIIFENLLGKHRPTQVVDPAWRAVFQLLLQVVPEGARVNMLFSACFLAVP